MDDDTGTGVFVRLVHESGTKAAPTLEKDAGDPNAVLCYNKKDTLRTGAAAPQGGRRSRRRQGAAGGSASRRRYSFADVFTRTDSTITIYEQCLHPLVQAAVESRYDGVFVELMASSTPPDRHVLLNYTAKIIMESLKNQLCARGTFKLDDNEKFQTSTVRLQQPIDGPADAQSSTSSFTCSPEKNRRYSVFFSQMEIGDGEEVTDKLEPDTSLDRHIHLSPIVKRGHVKGIRAEELLDMNDLTDMLHKTRGVDDANDVVSVLRIVSIDTATKQLEQCHICFVQLAPGRHRTFAPVFQQAIEARVLGTRYSVPSRLGTVGLIMRAFLDGRGQISLLVNSDTSPDDFDGMVGILSILSCEGTGMAPRTTFRKRSGVAQSNTGLRQHQNHRYESEVEETQPTPTAPLCPPAYNVMKTPTTNSCYPPIEHLTLRQSMNMVENPLIQAMEDTSQQRREVEDELQKVDSFLSHEEMQIRAEERAMEQEVDRIKKKQHLLVAAKIDREKKIIAQMVEEIKILRSEKAEQHKVMSRMGDDMSILSSENSRLKEKEFRLTDRIGMLERDLVTVKESYDLMVDEIRDEQVRQMEISEREHQEQMRLALVAQEKRIEDGKALWLKEVEAGVAEQLRRIQQQLQDEIDGKNKLMKMVKDLARCVGSEEQAKAALELVNGMDQPSPRRPRVGKSIYSSRHKRVLSHSSTNETINDSETVYKPKLRNTVHTITPQKRDVKKSDLYVLANRTEKDGVVVTQLFKGDVVKSVSGKGRSVFFTGMEEHSKTLPVEAEGTDKTDLVVFARSGQTKGSVLVSKARDAVTHDVELYRKRPVDVGDESEDDEDETSHRALLGDSAFEKLRRQRRCGVQIEGHNEGKMGKGARKFSGYAHRKYTKLT